MQQVDEHQVSPISSLSLQAIHLLRTDMPTLQQSCQPLSRYERWPGLYNSVNKSFYPALFLHPKKRKVAQPRWSISWTGEKRNTKRVPLILLHQRRPCTSCMSFFPFLSSWKRIVDWVRRRTFDRVDDPQITYFDPLQYLHILHCYREKREIDHQSCTRSIDLIAP